MTVSPVRVDQPEPGFYLVRLVRGGPKVAASISYGPTLDPETMEPLDRSWLWVAIVNGEVQATPSPDPVAAGCYRIWPAERCSKAEHDYRLSVAEHARRFAPDAPEANPREKIDIDKTPIGF